MTDSLFFWDNLLQCWAIINHGPLVTQPISGKLYDRVTVGNCLFEERDKTLTAVRETYIVNSCSPVGAQSKMFKQQFFQKQTYFTDGQKGK